MMKLSQKCIILMIIIYFIVKIIVWGSKYPEKYCILFENKTTEEDRSVPAFLFCELTMNILMHAVLSVAF